MRLKGRGLPADSRSSAAGDQYAMINVVAPAPDSEESREAYRRLAELLPADPRAHW